MKKLDYLQAKQKFADQGRNDIELIEENYRSWKREKAAFLDKVIGEIFWALPFNVYNQHSTHPKRALEQRKLTNIEKYGNSCSLHGKTAAAKKVQEKTLTSIRKRYGKNITCVFQSKEIKDKSSDSLIGKYGVTNISQLRKKTVIETEEYVEDWLAKQCDPKPASYQSFGAMFLFGLERKDFSLLELEEYLSVFRSSKTKLETFAEKLFETNHYNKKPPEQKIDYRPDFKLSETVYANVDGLYWHSENQKDKNYHFNLRKEFEKNNLTMFQFREDEIFNKSNIVKSIVSNKLGKCSIKLMARKTTIKTVSQLEAKVFLNENHLMGSVNAKHIGLYDKEDKLVAILSYKRRKNAMNIERYCSLVNCSISGGFSKLISHLENKCLTPEITEIHNWVDLRYGTGVHLLTKRFTQRTETLGWSWTDGTNTFNRLKCRANMDARKIPEKKHAEELGWYRIYDAGQRLYVKIL
jgi:hypothetical protein